MDEIDKRLKETSEECIKCYEAWSKDQKDSSKRETMLEAIHELRKVAARLEIEMAISERDQMASKPIPIPPHRSKHRANKGDDNGGAQDQQSDMHDNGGKKQPKVEKKGGERGAPRKRRSGGSSD